MKGESVTWERVSLAGCPAPTSEFGFDVMDRLLCTQK